VRNPQIGASVLEYFKDLQNKGLPVTREALMKKLKNMLQTLIHCGIFAQSKNCAA
jgi:hypothetical protein